MSQTNAPPKANESQLWDWFEKAPNHVVTCRLCKEDIVRREFASTSLGATFLRQELWKHLKWRHHTAYLITGHLPEHQVESTPFPYVTKLTLLLRTQRKWRTSKACAIASVVKSVSEPAASSQQLPQTSAQTNGKFSFTDDQRLMLCKMFTKTTYPSVAQRTELALQFNVREKSVANWFQRRRNTEWKTAGQSKSASCALDVAENTAVEGHRPEQDDANHYVAEADGPTQMDDSFEEEL